MFLKIALAITAMASLASLSAGTNIQKLTEFKTAAYAADDTAALIEVIQGWTPNGVDAEGEVLTKGRANEAALLVAGNAADIVIAKEAATEAATQATADAQSAKYSEVFTTKTALIKAAVRTKFNEAAGDATEGWLTTASLAGKMSAIMTHARTFGAAIATATRDALIAGTALIEGIAAQIAAAIESIRNYVAPARAQAARNIADCNLA